MFFNAFYNRTFCIYDHLKKRVIHIWPHRDKSSYVYYQFVQRFQIPYKLFRLMTDSAVVDSALVDAALRKSGLELFF
jgi:hypothetical protein